MPAERRAQCDAARRKTGRLTPSADATVDGVAVKAGRAVVVLPGPHAVRAASGSWARTVTIAAGEATTIEVPAATSASSTSAPVSSGNAGDPATPSGAGPRLSPVWAITAGAVTATLLGITIGSAIDTKEKHDAFVALGCDGPKHGDCTTRAQHGAFAQDRTNVLIGVTAGLAVATSVLGVVTILGGRAAPPAKTSAAIVVGPASLGVRVTFR